jgi:hypothetical protein
LKWIVPLSLPAPDLFSYSQSFVDFIPPSCASPSLSHSQIILLSAMVSAYLVVGAGDMLYYAIGRKVYLELVQVQRRAKCKAGELRGAFQHHSPACAKESCRIR